MTFSPGQPLPFEKQEGEFVSGFNEDSDFMSFSDGNEFTDETSSGTNSYILNTFLIAWLVFWLIFIVFFIIYVKRQSKKTINYFSLDSYQTDQKPLVLNLRFLFYSL